MNAQELALHVALHEAMDDVAVTDHDVARMESGLNGLIEVKARTESSHRRWRLAVAAAAVLVVLTVGVAQRQGDRELSRPAGLPVSDQPLVPADLVGTWQNVPDSPWVWEFTAEGEFSAHSTADDYLKGHAGDRIVARSGEVYTVKSAEQCDETWRIRNVRPGVVTIVLLTSPCRIETGEMDLERVAPAPYPSGELSPKSTTDDPGSIQWSPFINGVWLHAETGTVLAVGSPWGGDVLSYVVDDDGDGATNPDQRGRVTVSDDAPPVFRPDATEGAECVLRFSSVVIDLGVMTTTSADGGCSPAGSRQKWVRLT
ncbi:hypothetical protein V6K52_11955 [Knoellia sp. S7-12]|uniref:hypothetical protein n=1 Tax=Knoellia sp. S7-12 TaxID=3126698 RepID=UPI003368B958